MTREQRNQRAWVKWRKLISQQAKSGQSIAAFCRERRLCAPYFFQWKKRLSHAAGAEFVEVKVAARAVPSVARPATIEVRLRSGRSLLVEPGFDAPHLRALVAALETEA